VKSAYRSENEAKANEKPTYQAKRRRKSKKRNIGGNESEEN